MKKTTKKQKNSKLQLSDIAKEEYDRLITVLRDASADEKKLMLNDKLIMKVAELYATLELMKDLPTIIFDEKNPAASKETAAGKARVKYMAQYTNSMKSLTRDLLGVINYDDDDELEKYS